MNRFPSWFSFPREILDSRVSGGNCCRVYLEEDGYCERLT